MFKIEAGDGPGSPFLLTGYFANAAGDVSLIIEKNEWKVLSDNWDVEVLGKSITIRDAQREISLKLTADPPRNLIVERVKMRLFDYNFVGNKDVLNIIGVGKNSSTYRNVRISKSIVGFELS